MRLYELTAEYEALLEMAGDADVDEQTLADTMEAIEGEIEDKAEAYAKIIAELKGDAEKCKRESERLIDKKIAIEKNIERLKSNLKNAMEVTGKTKFKTDLFSFNIAKNGGMRSVILSVDKQSEAIPNEYRKHSWEADMPLIRKALESGKELEFATLLERGTHLSIK